jgi:hypothetical protein
MKIIFKTWLILAGLVGIAHNTLADFVIVIDGQQYYNGQTAYVDCSKSSVEAHTYQEYPQPDLNVAWSTSPNFSQNENVVQASIILTLDPNHNDGTVTMNVSGNGNVTVNVKQKPPLPTITQTSVVCTGQDGTFSATLNYNGSSSGLIWRTTGGITVNNSNSYTAYTNNSNVTMHNFAYGTYTVSGIITGCSNLEGPSVTGYIGLPNSSDITFVGTGGSDPGSAFCSGQTANFQSNPTLPGSQYSYSWSIPQGSSNVSYFQSSGPNANVTAGAAGGFVLQMTVSQNGCGTSSTSRTFGIRDCSGSYRVANNPTSNTVTVLFDSADDSQYLPTALQLNSEKQGKVKEVKVKGQHNDQSVKDGLKIDIDVHSLPRGTYYLQGIYDSNKTESVRIVLQ